MTEAQEKTKEESQEYEITTTFNARQVISFDVTEAAIKAVEQRWAPGGIPSDLTVKENYQMVKSGVSECRTLRSKVEAKRKELKADALAFGRKVDKAAGEITGRLLAIETPMKDAKTAHDTKLEIEKREKIRLEEERVQTIADKIAAIRAQVEASISRDSASIMKIMEELSADSPETWAQEFTEKALLAIAETTTKLQELVAMKHQSEQAAERQAKEAQERQAKEEAERRAREEEAARVAKENAAKQAALDEEKAQFEADKKQFAEAKAAAEKEEQDKKAAAELEEQAKKRAAEEAARKEAIAKEEESRKEAEAKRLVEEKKAAEEAKKQAKKEVDKRKKEALRILEDYVDEETAVDLLNKIIGGIIPHVYFE